MSSEPSRTHVYLRPVQGRGLRRDFRDRLWWRFEAACDADGQRGRHARDGRHRQARGRQRQAGRPARRRRWQQDDHDDDDRRDGAARDHGRQPRPPVRAVRDRLQDARDRDVHVQERQGPGGLLVELDVRLRHDRRHRDRQFDRGARHALLDGLRRRSADMGGSATCGQGVQCTAGTACGYGGTTMAGTGGDTSGGSHTGTVGGAADASAPATDFGSGPTTSALSSSDPASGGAAAICCSCGADGTFQCCTCSGSNDTANCSEGAACTQGSSCNGGTTSAGAPAGGGTNTGGTSFGSRDASASATDPGSGPTRTSAPARADPRAWRDLLHLRNRRPLSPRRGVHAAARGRADAFGWRRNDYRRRLGRRHDGRGGGLHRSQPRAPAARAARWTTTCTQGASCAQGPASCGGTLAAGDLARRASATRRAACTSARRAPTRADGGAPAQGHDGGSTGGIDDDRLQPRLPVQPGRQVRQWSSGRWVLRVSVQRRGHLSVRALRRRRCGRRRRGDGWRHAASRGVHAGAQVPAGGRPVHGLDHERRVPEVHVRPGRHRFSCAQVACP